MAKRIKEMTGEEKAARVAAWYAGQSPDSFDRHQTFNAFEAGNGPIVTINDEHYEKHFANDGDGPEWIVILWTDANGIECIG